MNTYKVNAFWDDIANVWVATSNDIAGLATEAENIDTLTTKLRIMIPELLTLNDIIDSKSRNPNQMGINNPPSRINFHCFLND